MDALLLIAFGRSAAFAAAPEREAVLHEPRGGAGGGARRAFQSAGASWTAGAPMQLESWSGALEADITQRHERAKVELMVAEAEAAQQQAEFAAHGGVVQPARPGARGGAFGDMLNREALTSGGAAPEWLSEVVDNAADMAGVEPQLAVQLGALRRAVCDCERALEFSNAMRSLVASPEAECPVCLETYEVAAVLPCLHATCRACMITHAASAASFRCPLCRKNCSRAEVVTFTKAAQLPVVLGVPVGPSVAAATGAVVQLSDQPSSSAAAAGAVVVGVVRQLSNNGRNAAAAATVDGATDGPLSVAALLQAQPAVGEPELPGASSRLRVLVALLRALLDSGEDERVLVFAQVARRSLPRQPRIGPITKLGTAERPDAQALGALPYRYCSAPSPARPPRRTFALPTRAYSPLAVGGARDIPRPAAQPRGHRAPHARQLAARVDGGAAGLRPATSAARAAHVVAAPRLGYQPAVRAPRRDCAPPLHRDGALCAAAVAAGARLLRAAGHRPRAPLPAAAAGRDLPLLRARDGRGGGLQREDPASVTP